MLNPLEALRDCLNCGDVFETGFIKSINSGYEVTQWIGGSRGADYIYVYNNGYFVNIKYLPTSKFISRRRGGRERAEEVYKVSKEVIEGKILLYLGFSRSGYFHPHVCIANEGVVKCCSCRNLEEDDKLSLEVASMFKPIGDEDRLVRLYLSTIPKLSNEILNTVMRSGAKRVFHREYAMRLYESLYKPGLSLLTTMALSTAQRRIQSLSTKISHILELAIIAKIVNALDGISLTEYWYIEFTKNTPLTIIKSRITGKEYTIFYQSSILPHILPGIIRGAPRHLIPDIVVFEGEVKDAPQRGLYRLVEAGKVPELVVEVKTGLIYSKWERPEYIVKQVKEYKELLKPKNTMIVFLKDADFFLKMKLRAMEVMVFENIVHEDVQKKFKNYILKILNT